MRKRPIIIAAVLTALLSAGGASAAAHTSDTPNLVPPAGTRLSSEFFASGVQVYRCEGQAWGPVVIPAANLVGLRGTTIHFRTLRDDGSPADPSWQSTEDGSLVRAKVFGTPSPVPGAIPELLLQSTFNSGDGIFGKVTFVHRFATSGGVKPAEPCVNGQIEAVKYRAKYRFFVQAS